MGNSVVHTGKRVAITLVLGVLKKKQTRHLFIKTVWK